LTVDAAGNDNENDSIADENKIMRMPVYTTDKNMRELNTFPHDL
jgi:hypothetical protein